jgi:hypothetical protein
MRRSIRCLFALALINAGCSSAAESTTPAGVDSVSPSAVSPAAAAPAREHLTRAIPRSAPTWVTLHTLPLAECALDAVDTSLAPQAAESLALYSDAEGMVHFQSRATDARASSVAMRLDCTDAAGKRASQEIDFVVDDAATPAPAPAARISRVHPALAGDPLSYSREELTARDLPPRPDPVASPTSFARWLDLATHPVNVIEPEIVASSRPHTRADARPTLPSPQVRDNGALANGAWSGFLLTDPTRDYFYIYGTWTVPQLTNEGGFWSTAYNSYWVGLGFNQDVVQAGVEGDTSSRVWVENSAHYAWYEWFPVSPITFANFPVSPGDEVTAWAWLVDANNYFSDQGQYAHYMIYDATQGNITSYGPYAKPFAAASAATQAAEWIVERPGTPAPDLAHYSTFSMTDAYVEDFRTHQLVDYSESGASSNQVTMTDSSGKTLSTVAPAGAGAMTFTWHAYN